VIWKQNPLVELENNNSVRDLVE